MNIKSRPWLMFNIDSIDPFPSNFTFNFVSSAEVILSYFYAVLPLIGSCTKSTLIEFDRDYGADCESECIEGRLAASVCECCCMTLVTQFYS